MQTDSSHIIAHTWMVAQAEEAFGKALQEACSNNIALNTPFIGPFYVFETILDVSKIIKNCKKS